jgi:hypothetical protein
LAHSNQRLKIEIDENLHQALSDMSIGGQNGFDRLVDSITLLYDLGTFKHDESFVNTSSNPPHVKIDVNWLMRYEQGAGAITEYAREHGGFTRDGLVKFDFDAI